MMDDEADDERTLDEVRTDARDEEELLADLDG
jgi:hypothetical protein